jgi:TnpA family transposase
MFNRYNFDKNLCLFANIKKTPKNENITKKIDKKIDKIIKNSIKLNTSLEDSDSKINLD